MERAQKKNEEFEESQKHNFHNKYMLCEDKKLGEGQHATVYECILKEDKKAKFAVKVTRVDDQEKLRAHEMEFKILERLNHPNIVRGVEMFRNDFKNEIC